MHETLHSNLLPVTWYAEKVYTAQTDLANTNAAWARFKENKREPEGGEFVVRGKQILSFRDLDHPAFRAVCEVGTIEEQPTTHWSTSEDPDLRRSFVELLNRALSAKVRQQGVRFDGDGKYYHFMATPDKRPREFRYRSRQNRTSREVFGPHMSKQDPKRVAYYRHSAFKGQFRRYGDGWFLEITPTYRFTSDGRALHPYAESYLQGIKEQENNDAVAGQVIMWAAFLNRSAEIFAREEFIRFGELLTFGLDAGVDDARWLERAPPTTPAADGDGATEEVEQQPQLGLGL